MITTFALALALAGADEVRPTPSTVDPPDAEVCAKALPEGSPCADLVVDRLSEWRGAYFEARLRAADAEAREDELLARAPAGGPGFGTGFLVGAGVTLAVAVPLFVIIALTGG
jgi:hypothetical protein